MPTIVGGDRVRKVRVGSRGHGAPEEDVLRVRRRVEQVFAPADLRPPGVPRGSIVCIRHARATLPRRHSQWTDAIEHGVRMLEGAHRPFVQPVPVAANVVYFADDAELLACAARDAHGPPAWWWTTLFGAMPLPAVVTRELGAAPAFVPAVLDLLDRHGICAETVAALDDAVCVRLARAVAAAHGVMWHPPALIPPRPFAPSASDARSPAAAATTRIGEARDAIARLLDPYSQLHPPQRMLVALGLSLRRLPAVAHMPAFAPALDEAVHLADGVASETVEQAGLRPAEARERITDGHMAPAPMSPPLDARAVCVACTRGDAERPPGAIDTSPATRADAPSGIDIHDAGLAPPPSTREPDAAIAPGLTMTTPAADLVRSEIAGVFYLVNVALRCGLYADFSNPHGANLSLPLPGLLAIAAQHTLGEVIVKDGIWRVLAEMSGRSPDLFELQPPAVLAAFEGVIAVMRAHVAESVDIAVEAALTFVCGQPGAIRLSPARVDVTFSLAAHPIVLRLAGLDRNPGWVPSAGRVIEFHYE